jgi:hypothetical protein
MCIIRPYGASSVAELSEFKTPPDSPPLSLNVILTVTVQSQPWYQTFWFFISMPYLRQPQRALTTDLMVVPGSTVVQHPKDAIAE